MSPEDEYFAKAPMRALWEKLKQIDLKVEKNHAILSSLSDEINNSEQFIDDKYDNFEDIESDDDVE